MGPLLHRRLEVAADLGGCPVPPRVSDRLRELYHHARLRSRAAHRQLAEIVAEARSASVPVVPLKGAYLATAVYEDPGLRPFEDLDLLVPDDDTERIAEVLRSLGYAPDSSNPYVSYDRHHHLPPFRRGGSLPVEVHRGLLDSGWTRPLDMDGIWRRVRPVEVADEAMLALAPEDILLHLTLHAAVNHRFRIPLLWLCDISELVQRLGSAMDWRLFMETVRETGTSELVWCALAVARDAVEAELPPGVMERLAPTGGAPSMHRTVRDYILGPDPDELPGVYVQLRHGVSLGRGTRLLARALFPPAPELRRIYGLEEHAPVAAYRLRHAASRLARGVGLLARALSESEEVELSARQRERKELIGRWIERAA